LRGAKATKQSGRRRSLDRFARNEMANWIPASRE
jgi:hypothetical protein